MRSLRIWIFSAAILMAAPGHALAQRTAQEVCPRPAVGSAVPEPEDLRSNDGVLRVELAYREFTEPNGNVRYCYIYKDGSEAPTLRLSPGDELIFTLKNELATPLSQEHQNVTVDPRSPTASEPERSHTRQLCGAAHNGHASLVLVSGSPRPPAPHAHPKSTDCGGGEMTVETTNVHFHGLTVPPVCHQDDVLNTMIQPGDPPFEYRFKIPADEPPGLYWYHPHIHGTHEGASARRRLGSADRGGNRAGESRPGRFARASVDRARPGSGES